MTPPACLSAATSQQARSAATSTPAERTVSRQRCAASCSASLKRWLGAAPTVVDGTSGEVVYFSHEQPQRDWEAIAELCREVARRGQPELIEEVDPLVTLAVPVAADDGTPLVAVAMFVTHPLGQDTGVDRVARGLRLAQRDVHRWLLGQSPVSPAILTRLAHLIVDRLDVQRRMAALEHEVRDLSSQISLTFEEISLIYRLTQHLQISRASHELGQQALEWLAEVVPAEGLILWSTLDARDGLLPDETGAGPRHLLLRHGACPLDEAAFQRLLAALELEGAARVVVANRQTTAADDWPLPAVRQLVIAPLADGEHVFGWLAAVNHVDGAEFGTSEASLLNSFGTILGIHSSNIDLYRQQAELLAGVVRAMSSAIDAKDPYTRGHSDRVARVAVRLAQELGCDAQTLKTIYLGGLLHDIGKIGIDDQVLRKPGKLTDAEYEHIKTHVEIGYRILRDLKKMQHILPIVLHHHESWDGKGYPYGMTGANIPFLARIVAVADAYDAMSSDRPYRQGMPDEKLDAIIRQGAGQQWDPRVVEAFFKVRDEIREISNRDAAVADVHPLQWV